MNRWTSKVSFLGRGAWAIGIATLAGALIAVLLVPTLPNPGSKPNEAVQVRLLGQPLPLDDQTLRVAMDRMRRYATAQLHLKLAEGKIRELSLGRLGVQIDKLRLTALIREARDPNSLLRRHFALSPKSGPLELPVPLVLDPNDAIRELLRIKDEADRPPSDARMNLETRSLTPEVEGRLLDVDRTFAALDRALSRGEHSAEAVFETLKPKRVAAELANVKFTNVLGAFETRYDRSDRSRDRTFNLRLAASKLDGHVLLPGEVFDFNEVVGPRDEANGYRVATVIAEGELVDGLGGGTCQISGTLHGAVFFAGLELVERIPHTRPSSYIKMGLDATVVYPTINFRFRNNYDFPVVLHESVKNGVVRAEVLGPERKHTVTFIRRITDVVPYEQLEREDPQLPRGVKILSQRGVAGFAVTRYRIVREGPHAVRERWLDRYPPTPQIVRVGTGDQPKDSVNATDDHHPEYVADELLVMTQSSDPTDPVEQPTSTDDMSAATESSEMGRANESQSQRDPRKPTADGTSGDGVGTLSEWRQAGKTGVAGWTRELGMPQWEPTATDTRRTTDREDKKTRGKAERSKRTARPNGG
ncbi:MAG: VanW family protein [Polyangiaceae bacterium]